LKYGLKRIYVDPEERPLMVRVREALADICKTMYPKVKEARVAINSFKEKLKQVKAAKELLSKKSNLSENEKNQLDDLINQENEIEEEITAEQKIVDERKTLESLQKIGNEVT
jgi:hypothetical protein